VADHVDVGGEVELGRQPVLDGRLAQQRADAVGTDPAVAVPLGAAVAQPYAVDHAVTHGPDVRDGVFDPERVGPVADVAAVQLLRDPARHRQREGGQLLRQWREGAFQETVDRHLTDSSRSDVYAVQDVAARHRPYGAR